MDKLKSEHLQDFNILLPKYQNLNMPSQDLWFVAEEIYQDQRDTQNKISSRCHSPSHQSENLEINLSDANIDPELVYFTRDLAEILRSQPSLDLESNLSPTLEDR